jgi:hypothetical protein
MRNAPEHRDGAISNRPRFDCFDIILQRRHLREPVSLVRRCYLHLPTARRRAADDVRHSWP